MKTMENLINDKKDLEFAIRDLVNHFLKCYPNIKDYSFDIDNIQLGREKRVLTTITMTVKL